MSDWPRQPPGRGTTLPTGAQDLEFYWTVDAVNGVVWHMIYDVGLTKWLFLGGPPLSVEVLTSEATTSTTYAALTTAGPVVTIPGTNGGLYIVELGAEIQPGGTGLRGTMSYEIGVTAAADADRVTMLSSAGGNANSANSFRRTRKTFASSVALTAKYKASAASSVTFASRYIALLPVAVSP